MILRSAFLTTSLRLLTLIGIALAIIPGSAHAQDAPVAVAAGQLLVAPESGPGAGPPADGYFHVQLAPGEVARGALRLRNAGKTPLAVELAAVDATTAQHGGSAFVDSGTPPAATAAWLELDQPRLTLPPQAERLVAFAVKPPAGTAPGQYLAGIAAAPVAPEVERAPAATGEVKVAIATRTRFVIGVQVDVPGTWSPSLTVAGVSLRELPHGPALAVALRNDGDVFLAPQGEVRLTDVTGQPLIQAPIALETVVPGTNLTLPIAWPETPLPGTYQVAVDLTYAPGKTARYRGSLVVHPEPPAPTPEPMIDEEPAPAPKLALQPETPAPGASAALLPGGARSLALAFLTIAALGGALYVALTRRQGWRS